MWAADESPDGTESDACDYERLSYRDMDTRTRAPGRVISHWTSRRAQGGMLCRVRTGASCYTHTFWQLWHFCYIHTLRHVSVCSSAIRTASIFVATVVEYSHSQNYPQNSSHRPHPLYSTAPTSSSTHIFSPPHHFLHPFFYSPHHSLHSIFFSSPPLSARHFTPSPARSTPY